MSEYGFQGMPPHLHLKIHHQLKLGKPKHKSPSKTPNRLRDNR